MLGSLQIISTLLLIYETEDFLFFSCLRLQRWRKEGMVVGRTGTKWRDCLLPHVWEHFGGKAIKTSRQRLSDRGSLKPEHLVTILHKVLAGSNSFCQANGGTGLLHLPFQINGVRHITAQEVGSHRKKKQLKKNKQQRLS